MKINLFDKLVEFVHAKKLDEDVLLFLAILRLKHARRDVWRVDSLQHGRFCNRISSFPISYNNKPSEFLGQDESFDCSPFSNG